MCNNKWPSDVINAQHLKLLFKPWRQILYQLLVKVQTRVVKCNRLSRRIHEAPLKKKWNSFCWWGQKFYDAKRWACIQNCAPTAAPTGMRRVLSAESEGNLFNQQLIKCANKFNHIVGAQLRLEVWRKLFLSISQPLWDCFCSLSVRYHWACQITFKWWWKLMKIHENKIINDSSRCWIHS